jgi:hypothetical protein
MGRRTKATKQFPPLPLNTEQRLRAFQRVLKEAMASYRERLTAGLSSAQLRALEWDSGTSGRFGGLPDYEKIVVDTPDIEDMLFVELSQRLVSEIDRVLADESRSVDEAFGLPASSQQARREERARELADKTYRMYSDGLPWTEIIRALGHDRVYLVRNLRRVYPWLTHVFEGRGTARRRARE